MGAAPVSIAREIAQLRNQRGLNFLSLALGKLQDAHNQLIEQVAHLSSAKPSTTTPQAATPAVSGSSTPVASGVTSLNGKSGAVELVGSASISVFPSGPNIGLAANGCLQSIGFASSLATVFGLSAYPATASFSIAAGGAAKVFLAYFKSATANTVSLLLATSATQGYQVNDTGAGTLVIYAYAGSLSAALVTATVPNYVGWNLLEVDLIGGAAPSNTFWAWKDTAVSGPVVDASVPMTGVSLSLAVAIDSAANIGDCQAMVI